MLILTVEQLSSLERQFDNGQARRVVIFDYDETIVGRDRRMDYYDTEAEARSVHNDYIGLGPHLYINLDTEKKLRAMKEQGFRFCIATRKDSEGAFEASDFLQAKNMMDLFDFMVYEKCSDDKKAMLNACVSAYPVDTQFTFLDDREAFIATARSKGIHAIQVGSQEDNPYNGPAKNSEQLTAALNEIPEFKTALVRRSVDSAMRPTATTRRSAPTHVAAPPAPAPVVSNAVNYDALLKAFKAAHEADLQKTCFGKTRVKETDSLASIVGHAMQHSGGFCGLFSTRSKRVLLKILKDHNEIAGSSAKAKLKTLYNTLNP